MKHRLRKLLSFFPGASARKCSWDEPLAFLGTGPRAEAGPLQVIREGDHTRGPDSAPVALVEYGDYQCKQCGEAYLEIEKLRQVLGDRLRFVFRQYPYAKLHPQAELAAEAAEAAAAQGKFWEMHGLLFRRQDALHKKDLLRYAETLGLDRRRFCWELKNRVYRDRVRHDFRSGVMNGVYSTPTIFINGIRHTGGLSMEALLEAVNRLGSGGGSNMELAV